MAEKAHRGIPVAVAVATDGCAGWFSAAPRPDPDDIVEIRRREWHGALDALGVSRADRFELEFPDGELSEHEDELTNRLGELFRRVRPSQVFVTSSGDPHPDHRTLTQAARRAADQIAGAPRTTSGQASELRVLGSPPQLFTYRVYPGEGLWPDGRPSRVTVGTAVALVARSISSLTRRRPLLFRAAGSAATKAAAIDAYDSQRKLLAGELRSVWGTGVELYWPLEAGGSADAQVDGGLTG
jgi:LmbE family N-acetylglucosaminyl deacetylase